MTQSTYIPVEIILEISDKIIGATTLKRKANFFTMIYNQSVKSLVLSWTVEYFNANLDGSYGNNISDVIPSFTKENIADNTTMVDQTTGEILLNNGDGTFGTVDQIVMGQYDWFNMMAETQQLPVHSLIRQYGAQVNWNLV